MADELPDRPYNKYLGDESKNMVVPGSWFNWVNNGLGMIVVLYDGGPNDQPYVEVNGLTGQLTFHLADQTQSLNCGWRATIVNQTVEINSHSIAMVNQKLYFLGTTITGATPSFVGLDRLCVWLECLIDSAGGDTHVLSVESDVEWPVFSPVNQPLKLIQPICEVLKGGPQGYTLHQHSLGLINIFVP